MTGVVEISTHCRGFGLRDIQFAVVVVVAVNDKLIVVIIGRTDHDDRIGLKALFVAFGSIRRECFAVGSGTAFTDRHIVPNGRAGIGVFTSNREDVADFQTVIDGRAACGNGHVVVLGLAVVGDFADNIGVLGLARIKDAVVGVVACDVKHFVGRIATDDLNGFGRKTLFVALLAVAKVGSVGAGCTVGNRHLVPDRSAGVGVFAFNRKDVADFQTIVDGRAACGNGHVVVLGLAVVGDFADNSREIGFGCVKLAAGKVFKRAVDDKGVTLGVAADLKAAVVAAARVRHRTVDRRVIPNRRPGIGVFGTVSNSEISALFIARVFPRAEFDGHVLIGCRAFVVERAFELHIGINNKNRVSTRVAHAALQLAVFERTDHDRALIGDRA